MFLGVNLYVPSICMICLCSCYILIFLPFSLFAGSGSQKTNILSTCGFLILTQLLLSNANPPSKWRTPKLTSKYGKDEALQHVRNLYRESLKKYRCVHLLWFDHPSFNASLLSIFLLKNQTKFSHFEIELTLIIFCTYYCCIHSDVSLFLHYFSLSLLIIRCSCLY